MKKSKTSFFCQHCGYMSPKWLGKCPSCNGWNCFAEELIVETGSDSRAEMRFDGKPLPIEDIPLEDGRRTVTDIAEVDRVLGGGIVGGSAILIGGEPGIGKSTLMLQMMHNLAQKGLKVLYVSGEESASQIKLRSDRIGAAAKRYYDPKVGRFVTKDPIGFDGGDFNLYAYTKNNPVNYVDPDGERISVFTRSLDMKVKSGGYVHCVLIVEKCDGTKRTWDFQYDNQVYSPAKSPSNPIKNPKTTVVYDKYDLDDKVSAIADKMPHPDYSKTKYNCCYWVKDVLRWVGISWENPNPWEI